MGCEMGREVRRVPSNWIHPRDWTGRYIPLFDGKDYQQSVDEWDAGSSRWVSGESYCCAGHGGRTITYAEWNGPRPDEKNYMPRWSDEECTHLMMYETCSEGTPISPAFETPEELARWLADTGASAFGSLTASYEDWLLVAQCAWVPWADEAITNLMMYEVRGE